MAQDNKALFDRQTALAVSGLAAASGVLTLVMFKFGAVAAVGLSLLGLIGVLFFGPGWAWRRDAELDRIAREIEDYRAVPRLTQAQGERVVDLTSEAAHRIAAAVRVLDDNAAKVAEKIDAMSRSEGRPDLAAVRQDIVDILQPTYGLLADLQFQDITRQQIEFLSKMSQALDAHMADLARRISDRSPIDAMPAFRDIVEEAMGNTVMTSQRRDLTAAKGAAHVEDDTPRVELFVSN